MRGGCFLISRLVGGPASSRLRASEGKQKTGKRAPPGGGPAPRRHGWSSVPLNRAFFKLDQGGQGGGGGDRERDRPTRHRRHHVCLPVGRDGSPILYYKIITRCIHWRCNIRLGLRCVVRGISISQSYNTICVPRIPPGNRRTSQTVTGGRYHRYR